MKRLLILLCISGSSLFAASGSYQSNQPFDYAVFAQAAGLGPSISKLGFKNKVEYFIKQHTDSAHKLIDSQEWKGVNSRRQQCYTCMLLVQDVSKNMHAIIHAASPCDEQDIIGLSQKICEWQKRHGKLATLAGCDAGAQIAYSLLTSNQQKNLKNAKMILFKDKHQFVTVENSQVITFWLAGNVLHINSNGKLKKVSPSKGCNGQLRPLTLALQGKAWSDVL